LPNQNIDNKYEDEQNEFRDHKVCFFHRKKFILFVGRTQKSVKKGKYLYGNGLGRKKRGAKVEKKKLRKDSISFELKV
jgi:hypothetical protein